MYEIKSYADIFSIAQHFLVTKQIGDQYFSKIFSIFIPALILSSPLKFQQYRVNYINQISVFYINVQTKLVGTFVTLKNFLLNIYKLQRYKLSKLKKRHIYGQNMDKSFTYTFSTYTIIIQPQHHLLGLHAGMKVLSNLISDFKISSYFDLNSLLRSIFSGL